MRAEVWITIIGLFCATVSIKAFGPLLFGGRRPHPLLGRLIPLLAPALLAGLVVAETFAGSVGGLSVGPRAGGVVVAGFAIWRRAPLIAVVILAAATTAVLRAIT